MKPPSIATISCSAVRKSSCGSLLSQPGATRELEIGAELQQMRRSFSPKGPAPRLNRDLASIRAPLQRLVSTRPTRQRPTIGGSTASYARRHAPPRSALLAAHIELPLGR